MPIQLRNELLISRPLECPLGRLSMAGTIRHGRGIPATNMRILGSYALVYLLNGSGRYADARGMDQKVSAGDLIVLYPEIAHAYGPGSSGHWDEIYLVFDGPIFDLWRKQNLFDDTRPVRPLEPIEYWFRRIKSIPESTATQPPLSAICLLQQLLADLREQDQAREVNDADRAWLARASALLEEDIPLEQFDLESIADRLGISYVGFRKKFARLANVSPAKFRMKAIMQRAADLIRRQDSSNREIAHRLGFCDEFHFSRRFKQLIGLSPREFRQQAPRER